MNYGIELGEEEDGSFSGLVDKLVELGEVMGLIGLFTRHICLQPSCQLIACMFSLICGHCCFCISVD